MRDEIENRLLHLLLSHLSVGDDQPGARHYSLNELCNRVDRFDPVVDHEHLTLPLQFELNGAPDRTLSERAGHLSGWPVGRAGVFQ